MDFYNQVCIVAEAALSRYRLYRIPKLKERLERMERYCDEIEKQVKRAREGDEAAMEDLIGLGFSEKEF